MSRVPGRTPVDDRDRCGRCGRTIVDLESGRRGRCRDCLELALEHEHERR